MPVTSGGSQDGISEDMPALSRMSQELRENSRSAALLELLLVS